jgi:phospholipase/carboxylesterase
MSIETELSFIHRFVPATDPERRPLLLLHGTGGNEDDLLPLGSLVSPGAALLSPRGKVLEGGMPRFFRRYAEGVFDEDDLRRRAGELADFIAEAQKSYGLTTPIAVGFSNGANIAAAVLQLRPEALAGAALLRPMVPLQNPPTVELAGKSVLILSGASDPIVPLDNAKRLASLLTGAGAGVQHRVLPGGHAVTQADLGHIKSWIDQL